MSWLGLSNKLLKTLYNILCKDEQTLDTKRKVEPDLLVTSQTTVLPYQREIVHYKWIQSK